MLGGLLYILYFIPRLDMTLAVAEALNPNKPNLYFIL